MNESDIRTELANTLHELGYYYWHQPDVTPWYREKDRAKREAGKKEEAEQKKLDKNKRSLGRIDLIFMNPIGPCVLVETKKIDLTLREDTTWNGRLAFEEISVDQRKMLDRWCFHGKGKGFLGVGTIGGPNNRKLWLIDWTDWVREETQAFKEFGGKYRSFAVHSSKGLGLTNLFLDSELVWNGTATDIHWAIPDHHKIRGILSAPHPAEEWEPISLRFGPAGVSGA